MLERNLSLDILKLAMAFMIIGVHAEFLRDFSELGRYLTVNGIFRIGVPIFLVINGFYFYPVISNNNQYMWLKRIFILYLFWMLFYSWYWFYVPDLSIVGVIKFLDKFIIGFWHLWYLSGLLGAALVLIFLKRKTSVFLGALMALTFLAGVFVQYVGHYHLVKNPSIDHLLNLPWAHRNFFLFSFPFFCAGFLINKHSLQNKISDNAALMLGILGLALLIAESYLNFRQINEDRYFDNFLSLLFVCPAVFIFFIKQNIMGRSKQISLYSSAIYYIHALVLILLSKYINFGTLLTLLGIVVSVVAAFVVIKINEKLKFIL